MKKKLLMFVLSIIIIGQIYAKKDVSYFSIEKKYDDTVESYTVYPNLGSITISTIDYQYKNIYLFFGKKKILLRVNFDNSTENIDAFDVFNEDSEINNIISTKDNIIAFSKKNREIYVLSKSGETQYIINNKDLLGSVEYILPYKNETFLIINDIGEIYLMNIKGNNLIYLDSMKRLKIKISSIIKYSIKNENLYYLTNENKIYRYNIKNGEMKEILECFPYKIIDFSVKENNDIFILYRDNKMVKGSYLLSKNKVIKVFCELPLDMIFEENIKILNIDNNILIIGSKGYRIYDVNKIINE